MKQFDTESSLYEYTFGYNVKPFVEGFQDTGI